MTTGIQGLRYLIVAFEVMIVMTLSRLQAKLLDAAEAICLNPDKVEAAYLGRQLIQATLPHKNPGEIPAWSRTNGNLTLTIRPGWDDKKTNQLATSTACFPAVLVLDYH